MPMPMPTSGPAPHEGEAVTPRVIVGGLQYKKNISKKTKKSRNQKKKRKKKHGKESKQTYVFEDKPPLQQW